MLWLRKSFVTLIMSTLTCHAAHIQAIEFYVVDYPPHILVNENDQTVSGMDVDIVTSAFAAQGEQVIFKVMPWKRILKSMELGLIPGTVSCTARPGRSNYIYFSDPLSYVIRAVVSLSNLRTVDIKSVPDLKHFSVATVDGWGMQKKLKEFDISHQTAPDLDSAIKAVRYRNVDLLYMAEYPARYVVNEMGMSNELKVTPLIREPRLPLHLCVSKGFPGAQKILATANAGLEKIKANGVLEAIRASYLNTTR